MHAFILSSMAVFMLLAGPCRVLATGKIIVRDLNGATIAPLKAGKPKATVLIFITNDCPIANACAPEIERIYKAYAQKQVRMYLVYVDPSLTAAAARAHREAYKYTCPALLDPEHKLVAAAKAAVTPEAAIFDRRGKLIYHGRIDNRAVTFGQVRAQPTQHDLRNTLDEFLQGKLIKKPHIAAVGCSIFDLGHK